MPTMYGPLYAIEGRGFFTTIGRISIVQGFIRIPRRGMQLYLDRYMETVDDGQGFSQRTRVTDIFSGH